MVSMSASAVAPVHLILGEEDFIGERIRRAILDQLRTDAPDLELTVMRQRGQRAWAHRRHLPPCSARTGP